MKKILITGNLGYVAPALISALKERFPNSYIIGVDTGFYQSCNSLQNAYSSIKVDKQIYADIRDLSKEVFRGVDVVVHLAAISNDPMGERYSEITRDVNYSASLNIAEMAKVMGVSKFVFASSCSVYGAADTDGYVNELSQLNPVTTYAKSKIDLELMLESISSESFGVICLRFATACGASDCLRLDLVLNDFVYSALKNKAITILSDGTPWRPLIDTQDMALALVWACTHHLGSDQLFLALNAGSNRNNFQVSELAHIVRSVIGDEVIVNINKNANPDSRSYKVDFSMFSELASFYQPQISIEETIKQLVFSISNSVLVEDTKHINDYKRLNVLNSLQKNNKVDGHLYWSESNAV